jgi:hypothetical protein
MQNPQNIKIKRTSEIVLGVFFLACGCVIYLLFRSKTLNIYQWCVEIGLSDMIDTLRSNAQNWNVSEFLKFSLPDGLYCAAYILIIDAIWYKEDTIKKNIIIALVPFVTISSEVLQYLGLVKGTYDVYDLTCYSFPPLIYITIKSSAITCSTQ